jgi:restriction endonuclease S subunit
MRKLNQEDLKSYEISFPFLAIQHDIVAEIEAERAMVEVNQKPVEVFEQKLQARLAEVFGSA